MIISVGNGALSQIGLVSVLLYKPNAYSQMFAVCTRKSSFREKESTVKKDGYPADIDFTQILIFAYCNFSFFES